MDMLIGVLIGIVVTLIAAVIWYLTDRKQVVAISSDVIAEASSAQTALKGAEQAASLAASDLKKL